MIGSWFLLEQILIVCQVTKGAGFVKSDGYIVDIDGKSPLRFNVASGNYFIVVEHRNHLAIKSSEPVAVD